MGGFLSFPFEHPVYYLLLGLVVARAVDFVASRVPDLGWLDAELSMVRVVGILLLVGAWPALGAIAFVFLVLWLVFPGILKVGDPPKRLIDMPPPPPPPWPNWPAGGKD